MRRRLRVVVEMREGEWGRRSRRRRVKRKGIFP